MPRSRAIAWVGVLALTIGVRLALLLAASDMMIAHSSKLERRDVSLMHDGRLYLLVARSFPAVYQKPRFEVSAVDYPRLTVYMPLLPAAIWVVDAAVRDLRTSALVAPLIAACLAVVAFARLARAHVQRPLLAAALFAVVPPTWVLVSAMPFSESVLMVSAILAFVAFFDGRHVQAALWAGVAAVAQKSGFLVAIALVYALVRAQGLRGWRTIALYALAAVPALMLQLYLYHLFGDPLVNVRATREVYGAAPFGVPGASILAGLLLLPRMSGGDPWPNRVFVIATLVLYAGALWVARRDTRPGAQPLRAWVGVVLGFSLLLGGNWAYYNFPRLMVLAAPAAVLLWLRRFEARLGPIAIGATIVAGIGLSFWYGLESVSVSIRIFEAAHQIETLVNVRNSFF